jgi:polar amino acid transport system substrate-binding protein
MGAVRRFAAGACCLAAISGLLSGPAVCADRESVPALIVGVQDDDRPFAYKENNELKGFNVDITKAICKQMNRVCGIKPMSRWDLKHELKAGTVDFVVDGWTSIDDAEAGFLYSHPYYRSRDVFITADSSQTRLSPTTIAGKTVGVLSETAGEKAVNEHCASRGAVISTFMNNREIFDAVAAGHVDVGYVEGYAAYTHLKSPEGFAMNPVGLLPGLAYEFSERCIAVRKDRGDLLSAINRAVDEAKLTGRYQQISLTYFAFMNY